MKNFWIEGMERTIQLRMAINLVIRDTRGEERKKKDLFKFY